MEDAVGVKRQKEKRMDSSYEKPTNTVQTDIIIAQKGVFSDAFSVFAGQKEHRNHLDNQLMCHLSANAQHGRLPIVVIADGARSIRKKLTDLLGFSLIFILDWYHLSDKIWQYMSQISLQKSQKEIDAKAIIALLWKGCSDESINYLQNNVTAKNESKKTELIEYLTKHKGEIIDYEKRKSVGKKIGSGCVEKANDIIIAHRQKKKGMAWSNNGSESLAILKTLEINQQWQQFWANAA